MKRASIVLAACVLLAGGVCADELHLKDGSVINGTIVGFDENSFKVKTNYGYAMVRKDQVVSIEVHDADADATKKPDRAAKPSNTGNTAPAGSSFPSANNANSAPASRQPAARPAPTPQPPVARSTSTGPNPAAPEPASMRTSAPVSSPVVAADPPPKPAIEPTKAEMKPPTKRAPASGSNAAAAKPPAIEPAAPSPAIATISAPQPSIPKPTPPEPIRESIDGTTYTNETYGFRMFRPPGWEMIEDARSVLPTAVAALGTNDQTTYLLVGESASAGSLDADLKASDRKLREMVENYRPLGDKQNTIAGLPAIERHFRGAVDGKDWSGTLVLIVKGKELFTFFGMTYAGTDLVQIQENVIHRTITSLKFTK